MIRKSIIFLLFISILGNSSAGGLQPAGQTSGFQLLASVSANGLFPVHKYVSTKTGLIAVIAQTEGPIVGGYFALATEAHDDDGLPHTLEHLIFLGSELYPYKGVLDLLANRCFASGTNGWTNIDHTCYTIKTAGSEGFLNLLPIYLDHILYPTLTDSGFLSEVHHINGEGKDGGVVYSEMQGVENTGERKVNRELIRALYPGDSGYKSQTGGIMHNLRVSTNNTKVLKYHRQFYRPENLYVIVVGNVKPHQVLEAIVPFEERIISKGARGPFCRPWQSPVEPLTASVVLDVPYPSDAEESGMVFIGWRGPSPINDVYRMTACSILLKYLTDTSVSPLPKVFVDVPDPFASKVSYTIEEYSVSVLQLYFDNVPKEKLGLVKDKLDRVFRSILESDQPIDMKRLATVIHRHRLGIASNLENSPQQTIATLIIGHMLFGNSSQDLDDRLNQVRELDKMANEPMEFWTSLLRTYLVEGPCVVAKGIPSVAEKKAMAKAEEDRVAQQVQSLGPQGLKQKQEELANATAKNDVLPPEEMLRSVPIPSTDTIQFYKIASFTSDSPDQDPRFNLTLSPVYMQLDHLQTNFVYLKAVMDSSKVDSSLKLYLPLLLELLQESPVRRNGQLVNHEEAVSQLEANVVSFDFRIGLKSSFKFLAEPSSFQAGPFSSSVNILLQLEPKKYENGIKLIRELLYERVLIEERVKVIATKIINKVAEERRKGSTMTYDLMRGLLYGKKSNHYAVGPLRQLKFLSSVLLKLEKADTAKEVLADLERLRSILTSLGNLVIHVAANLDVLKAIYPSPASLWSNFLPPTLSPQRTPLQAVADWKLLEEKGLNESCVAGSGSVESAFFCQTVSSISDFNDPDLPKILVFFQYVTQMEGPMWRQIRGQGLAYSYSIDAEPNEGKIYFYLYRASNIVASYKEARNVLQEMLKGDVAWDKNLFESAKSSLIFKIINKEESIEDVVDQSLLSYFIGVGHDYNQKLVKQISNVRIEDMTGIGSKYVTPLLDPGQVKTTVICHSSKVEEVANGLQEFGLKLKKYSNLEESFLNEL